MARIEQTLLPLRESGLGALADDIVDGKVGLSDVYNEFMRGLAQAARAERLRNGSLARSIVMYLKKCSRTSPEMTTQGAT